MRSRKEDRSNIISGLAITMLQQQANVLVHKRQSQSRCVSGNSVRAVTLTAGRASALDICADISMV